MYELSIYYTTNVVSTVCGAYRAVQLTEWALLAGWRVRSAMLYLKIDLTLHSYSFFITLRFQPLSALMTQKKVAKLELGIGIPVPMDVE